MNYFSIFLFFLSFYFVYSSGDWNAEDFAEIMKQSQEAENNKHASLLNPTTSYHGMQKLNSYIQCYNELNT
uniref:Uncharacterized protein n=1 Tax=Meloidogyne enterolobii TaxID=390850 RepID=A0A6V7WER6_MELEN|nr:unnamed protein product [Meloidogyne enterolobii]